MPGQIRVDNVDKGLPIFLGNKINRRYQPSLVDCRNRRSAKA